MKDQPHAPQSTANLIDDDLRFAVVEGLDVESFCRVLDSHRDRIAQTLALAAPGSVGALAALKILNLIASQYHFRSGHVVVPARPTQITMDPTNSCMLSCPGCVHSQNQNRLRRRGVVWANGNLKPDAFQGFMDAYGPYATSVLLYNFGEPLLNPRFYDLARIAKANLAVTMTSSNLNIPKLDADKLVTCGLDLLMVAIDGATQESYETFRKGGKIDLAFRNIEKIVEARDRLGVKTPSVQWQYLTFAHNVHEVDMAIEKARALGIDSIKFGRPRDVSMDDKSIRAVDPPAKGVMHLTDNVYYFRGVVPKDIPLRSVESLKPHLTDRYHDRARSLGAFPGEKAQGSTCEWLYQNISLEGNGNLLPCCIPPVAENGAPLMFGDLGHDGADAWNTPAFTASRARTGLDPKRKDAPDPAAPNRPAHLCTRCRKTFRVIAGRHGAEALLRQIVPPSVLSKSDLDFLTKW